MSANAAPAEATQPTQDRRKREVYAEQVRLLYSNANAGVWITALAATLLSYLQWRSISRPIVLAWLIYMLVISAARFALARRYSRRARTDTNTRRWANTFTVGTALSAMGWGAAGFLLYPEAQLANQVILAFVLGGMMLGAGSVLASRPEAFLAFMVPIGLPISVRFLLERDNPHLVMGLLATIFTVAILITTWRIYLTVRSSLNLQFENQDLVTDLQNTKNRAETLNQELEHLASHDALTGIPNRRLLEDRLEQALARADRQHHKVAILALDLDDFKKVNDKFGHRFGDVVLKSIVTRVKARLRAFDTLARVGGDEFTVVADVADAVGAQVLVSALELVFAQPFEVEGELVTTEVSIGVALYPDHGRCADDLRATADKVMYVAKRSKSVK